MGELAVRQEQLRDEMETRVEGSSSNNKLLAELQGLCIEIAQLRGGLIGDVSDLPDVLGRGGSSIEGHRIGLKWPH
jgi:hypothetical protein